MLGIQIHTNVILSIHHQVESEEVGGNPADIQPFKFSLCRKMLA
jgi:hypothetical protein